IRAGFVGGSDNRNRRRLCVPTVSGAYPEPVTAPGAPGVLTLRDLVSLPRLEARLLTDSAGLDVPVRWAHPTELLDPRPYLSGGELVLTVGSSLRTDLQCRDFVDRLLSARTAAL